MCSRGPFKWCKSPVGIPSAPMLRTAAGLTCAWVRLLRAQVRAVMQKKLCRPVPLEMIGSLTVAGAVMGACLLVFCTAALAIGKYALDFSTEQVRTLTFIAVVFGGQAMIYPIRERKHLWSSRPSAWLLASSVADVLIASALAITGLAMTPLPPLIVGGTLVAAVALALVLDLVKIPVFARLGIA